MYSRLLLLLLSFSLFFSIRLSFFVLFFFSPCIYTRSLVFLLTCLVGRLVGWFLTSNDPTRKSISIVITAIFFEDVSRHGDKTLWTVTAAGFFFAWTWPFLFRSFFSFFFFLIFCSFSFSFVFLSYHPGHSLLLLAYTFAPFYSVTFRDVSRGR